MATKVGAKQKRPLKGLLNSSTKRMMTQAGMELRSFVLHTALQLEWYSVRMLAILLDVDRNNSVVCGNTSRSLSFDARMQLLMEMRAWGPEHKTKLLWFMQLRNQMMHNYDARTMVECMSFTQVKPKELLKAFPQEHSLPEEEQLTRALLSLSDYVLQSSNELMIAALDKMMLQSHLQMGIIDEIAKNHLAGVYDARRARPVAAAPSQSSEARKDEKGTP
ncbi:MAG: hypothetical protein KF843_11910 [Flavobacteriales bacterium]|nr:hypothetical protein [Flavobacteriales bacterium]